NAVRNPLRRAPGGQASWHRAAADLLALLMAQLIRQALARCRTNPSCTLCCPCTFQEHCQTSFENSLVSYGFPSQDSDSRSPATDQDCLRTSATTDSPRPHCAPGDMDFRASPADSAGTKPPAKY